MDNDPKILLKNPNISKKLLLAEELLRVSSNPDFRNLIFMEAGKKTDGDYNFLLSSLKNETHLSKLLTSDDNLYLLIEENQNSENGLQLYIPYFEERVKFRETNYDSDIVLVFQELEETK